MKTDALHIPMGMVDLAEQVQAICQVLIEQRNGVLAHGQIEIVSR